jgi:hypothetical protein
VTILSSLKEKLPMSDSDEEFSEDRSGSWDDYIPDEREASISCEVRKQYDVILRYRTTWMLHNNLVTCNESPARYFL